MTAERRADGALASGSASGTKQSPEPPWPRWRVLLVRTWAALLTLLLLSTARGIVSLAAAGPDERFSYATSTMGKLLSLGGVAWVFWTGARSVVAYWLIALGQVVWLVAGVFAPQADGNSLLLSLVTLLIFYGPLVALRPQRRQLLHVRLQPHRVLVALSLGAAVPLVVLALRGADPSAGSELSFDMTGLFLVLAALALFAALRPHRGWALPYLVAAGTAWTGLAGILLPTIMPAQVLRPDERPLPTRPDHADRAGTGLAQPPCP